MIDNTPVDTATLQTENERLRSLIKQLNEGSEKWYKTLFEKSSQALAVCDTFSDFPATILDCNDEFLRLLKRGSDEIMGYDFMSFMQKGEKRKFFVQSFGNTKEKDIHELSLVFLDGMGKAMNLNISTTYFNTPKGRMSLVTVHPENRHKSILRDGIEQLLSQGNQVFFSLREDDILQFDYISLSIYKVTGYASDQLLLNPFLFWNNCHPEDLSKLKKILKNKKPAEHSLNLRFIRKDGQMIWLDFSIMASPSRENGNAKIYAVARETTALQKKERQLAKRESYDQLLLQSAKSLIGQMDDQKLKSLANYIGSQLPGDRFSIYFTKDEGDAFSHDVFAEYITMNTKTYAASNSTTWEEFKDEFINLPVLVYQSDKENFNLKQKYLTFFHRLKVKSILIVPLLYKGDIFGYIACSTLVKHCRWDRTDINYLSQLSQLLSQAFHPKNRV